VNGGRKRKENVESTPFGRLFLLLTIDFFFSLSSSLHFHFRFRFKFANLASIKSCYVCYSAVQLRSFCLIPISLSLSTLSWLLCCSALSPTGQVSSSLTGMDPHLYGVNGHHLVNSTIAFFDYLADKEPDLQPLVTCTGQF